MESTEKNRLLPFPEDMERTCIAVRHKRRVVYMYPIDRNVLDGGAKVMTRGGEVVRHVRYITEANGNTYYTGQLNDKLLRWDEAGRFAGPYRNHENDLYIPERYFDSDWKMRIHLTNSEWALLYEREHPYCVVPEKQYNEEFRKYYEEYSIPR